ncbi:MAG: hypothetical protein H6713_16830 [Myxococcales bacterium]|nr:hypothetical protein [Myxococcales bacterium]
MTRQRRALGRGAGLLEQRERAIAVLVVIARRRRGVEQRLGAPQVGLGVGLRAGERALAVRERVLVVPAQGGDGGEDPARAADLGCF